jgi:hypothetical protein
MRFTREPADAIAARAGVGVKEAYGRLKAMTRKGQLCAGREDRRLAFGLLPFAVGIYEEQLPRMDRESADLFEEYSLETKGASGRCGPPIDRVVPVEEAVPAEIEIYPYERASGLLENAKLWGVRDCICRVQQKLVGKGCDRPVEACLVFAPVEGAFERSKETRAIRKKEA